MSKKTNLGKSWILLLLSLSHSFVETCSYLLIKSEVGKVLIRTKVVWAFDLHFRLVILILHRKRWRQVLKHVFMLFFAVGFSPLWKCCQKRSSVKINRFRKYSLAVSYTFQFQPRSYYLVSTQCPIFHSSVTLLTGVPSGHITTHGFDLSAY